MAADAEDAELEFFLLMRARTRVKIIVKMQIQTIIMKKSSMALQEGSVQQGRARHEAGPVRCHTTGDLHSKLGLEALELGVDCGVVLHLGKLLVCVDLDAVDVAIGLGDGLLLDDLALELVELGEGGVDVGGVDGGGHVGGGVCTWRGR